VIHHGTVARESLKKTKKRFVDWGRKDDSTKGRTESRLVGKKKSQKKKRDKCRVDKSGEGKKVNNPVKQAKAKTSGGGGLVPAT